MTTTTDTYAAQLQEEIESARRDVRTDSDHWEELACGQDTEEAEESGRLIGYQEGLEEALRLYKEDHIEALREVKDIALRATQEEEATALSVFRAVGLWIDDREARA